MAKKIKEKWELEKKINHSFLKHDVLDFIQNATDEDMILDTDKAEKYLDDVINELTELKDEVKNFED